ncbi:hypothetical protein C8Q72DRAFT_851272 [Fomitopsis betulina]|nr:hypothetical protein C8Q72DRAFT_851272 [Fomitopsis betulina]
MRIPSFAAPRTLGLAHSRSAGTLAVPSSPCDGAASERRRWASTESRSGSRRRMSNPFSSLGRSSGHDAPFHASGLPTSSSRTASFNLLSALSPVREQAPSLPLAASYSLAGPNVDALGPSVAALHLHGAMPEPNIGHDISTALAASLSSASSLRSLASLLPAACRQSPIIGAGRTPRASRYSAPQADNESPIAYGSRSARRSSMSMQRSSEQYTFCARVPEGLSTEMVTVYVKRGCRLAIVADAWHLEHDAHHKWEIGFTPEDVNLGAVHVLLDVSGNLTLNVPRRGRVCAEQSVPIFV